MQITPIKFNDFACNNRNRADKSSKVSFKQVTPEHFFIKMTEYQRYENWGQFVADLANSSKNVVLKPLSTVKNSIFSMGKKYKIFMQQEFASALYYGVIKKHFHGDLSVPVIVGCKYDEYYPACKKLIEKSENNLHERTTSSLKKLKTCQIQNEVDGKEVVLTQIGYLARGEAPFNYSDIYLIHPPCETREILINKSQKILDELKQYKHKELTKRDINKIYEKIGAIHWCIAQGMPFQRGSAAIADIYTKSLFESFNIQTTPWKKKLAPDWEAFTTPLNEYSKKYRTFFEE